MKLSGQGTVKVAEAARQAVLLTLDKMAKGGIYDHLAGGFHRYSVDEHWVVPHFEKMAYDNSELLKNYVHAYQAFGEEEFARVARDVMRWMDEWLSDRELGGFYASQDADFSLDDDGDYFTWTLDEAAEVLTAEELAIAAGYYNIGEIGDMQHNVAKNVLHVKRGLDVVARKAGVGVEEALALLDSAKRKMMAARLERPTPYVDKTMYVAWNAMCISAYLEAGRVLDAPEARAFALKSLDRVLGAAWGGREQRAGACGGVWRAGSEGRARGGRAGRLCVSGPRGAGCVGDDRRDALLRGGGGADGERAGAVLRSGGRRLLRYRGGGGGGAQAGRAGTRRKPLQDSPTPAGNPMAAMLLMRLQALNGSAEYAAKAQETLEAFAGVVEHFGLYAATYALALQRMVTPAGAGVRDRRRCGGARAGGRGRGAVCGEQERGAAEARAVAGQSPERCHRRCSRRCRTCPECKAASRWCAAGIAASLRWGRWRSWKPC